MKDQDRNFRVPPVEECDSSDEYDIGDEVYLDFGESGRLGAGEVSAKFEFEYGGEIYEVYEVKLPLTGDEHIHLGMFGSEMVVPADECNSSKTEKMIDEMLSSPREV